MIASLSTLIVSFKLSIFSSVAGLGHFCQLAFFPFLLQTDWPHSPLRILSHSLPFGFLHFGGLLSSIFSEETPVKRIRVKKSENQFCIFTITTF